MMNSQQEPSAFSIPLVSVGLHHGIGDQVAERGLHLDRCLSSKMQIVAVDLSGGEEEDIGQADVVEALLVQLILAWLQGCLHFWVLGRFSEEAKVAVKPC